MSTNTVSSKELHDYAQTPDSVRQAIASGILNQKDEYGWPFTCLTLRCGNVEGFRMLAEAGANLTAKTPLNFSPADLATSWGQTEVVEILHTKGFDLSDARYNALIHREENPDTYAKCVELGIPPSRSELAFTGAKTVAAVLQPAT